MGPLVDASRNFRRSEHVCMASVDHPQTNNKPLPRLELLDRICEPIVTLQDKVLNFWADLPGLKPLVVPEQFLKNDSSKFERVEDANASKASVLYIENLFYEADKFRKLHLEVAVSGVGLEVLHIVMYPRVEYDLPIYAVDIVGFKGRVTFCIADLCPFSNDLSLPLKTEAALEKLAKSTLIKDSPTRETPDWGLEIFSSQCAIIAPDTSDDVQSFLKFASGALEVLLAEAGPLARSDEGQILETLASQKRFSFHQLRNVKTRKVLEASMGTEWTDRYMTEIMFDYPEYP
eukprot:CAMPEP_0198213140 /NCGR_PEP_ID=MMETSP1445-20131203/28695_1 /TAXON_ID=36898 /ORGANISM="Pyramimonas sp., Strain CCMP2087" /LENGTH=289 /DNA_ID=CAMNT_0043887741 /DNA_START=234 /DNA_END=1103 /DNA_ORIENTATION=-